MAEFTVTDFGLGRWKWQVNDQLETLAESKDHTSEAACADELNRLIDACRQDPRPTVLVKPSKL